MKMKHIEKLQMVVKNLETCGRVTRYSTPTENQADVLANAFLDMEDTMGKIVNELIPRLYFEGLDANQVDDLILDIGEELRHVLYHIHDTKVYDYLKEK